MLVTHINSSGNEVANAQGTLLASLARTASLSSPNQTNYNARGVHIILNVTAASGTGGLTLHMTGLTPSGASYWMNTNPTAVLATGVYVYELYPGIGTASGGVTKRDSGSLPRAWSVFITAGDATSYTYSVEYSLIL